MSQEIAIQVDGLGKRYRLGSTGGHHSTLVDLLAASYRTLLTRKPRSSPRKETFWALSDATFQVKRGENVGVIGLNGAGKSTLLKILSRITEPTAGTARITGRVGALLEVGTGFHWELTGRENAYLYGSILGMPKKELAKKFDAIVEFAGIEEFIDTPVKRYSSGMYVRLAFAVAAHLEPEILLIDEVLAVGDLPFQRKCMEFAKQLQKGSSTILFVSHNMFSIKTMCPRVIYLKQGHIAFDGPTGEGIRLYEEDCQLSPSSWGDTKPEDWPISVTEFGLFDDLGREKVVFRYGERLTVRLTYEARRPVSTPNFIIAFIRSDGVACCNYSTETDGLSVERVSGEGVIELTTPPIKLVSEQYTVYVIVREREFQELLCAQIGSTCHVQDDLLDPNFGVFHESARWVWRHDQGETSNRNAEGGGGVG